MARYTITGVNDEADFCMCCGKRGLKRVAWMIERDSDGEIVGELHVGTTCAAIMLGYAVRGSNGRVKPSDGRRVIVDYMSEKWRQILATPVKATVSCRRSNFPLRDGQIDYVFQIEGGDKITSPSRDTFETAAGLGLAKIDAASTLTRRMFMEFEQEWYVLTGLKTTIRYEWDKSLNHAAIRLEIMYEC